MVILEFGQGLWFGNMMENLLINPDQCQTFGIQIRDDPTNPNWKLVIEATEDLFISMKMEVSTCMLVTHPPTDNELHEYRNILLSDEFDWDPSKNLF